MFSKKSSPYPQLPEALPIYSDLKLIRQSPLMFCPRVGGIRELGQFPLGNDMVKVYLGVKKCQTFKVLGDFCGCINVGYFIL